MGRGGLHDAERGHRAKVVSAFEDEAEIVFFRADAQVIQNDVAVRVRVIGPLGRERFCVLNTLEVIRVLGILFGFITYSISFSIYASSRNNSTRPRPRQSKLTLPTLVLAIRHNTLQPCALIARVVCSTVIKIGNPRHLRRHMLRL